MTIAMLQNARNWATKHQKFASGWGSAPDPAKLQTSRVSLLPIDHDTNIDVRVLQYIETFIVNLRHL